jgi:ribosomal protein L7Ae-like RNA K-turn-binding protein
MLNINKITTYLGFAIKSKKIIFGYDNLLTTNKKINLVIMCSTLNDKMIDKVSNYCLIKNIMYIKLDDITLSTLIKRDNCKVIAICDENLSKAIINEFKMENA